MNGRTVAFPDRESTLVNIQRARLRRAARDIIDDPNHPGHLQLMAILELEIALDVEAPDWRAGA